MERRRFGKGGQRMGAGGLGVGEPMWLCVSSIGTASSLVICESLAAEIEMVGMDSVMIVKGERMEGCMIQCIIFLGGGGRIPWGEESLR